MNLPVFLAFKKNAYFLKHLLGYVQNLETDESNNTADSSCEFITGDLQVCEILGLCKSSHCLLPNPVIRSLFCGFLRLLISLSVLV